MTRSVLFLLFYDFIWEFVVLNLRHHEASSDKVGLTEVKHLISSDIIKPISQFPASF